MYKFISFLGILSLLAVGLIIYEINTRDTEVTENGGSYTHVDIHFNFNLIGTNSSLIGVSLETGGVYTVTISRDDLDVLRSNLDKLQVNSLYGNRIYYSDKDYVLVANPHSFYRDGLSSQYYDKVSVENNNRLVQSGFDKEDIVMSTGNATYMDTVHYVVYEDTETGNKYRMVITNADYDSQLATVYPLINSGISHYFVDDNRLFVKIEGLWFELDSVI